MKKQNNNKKCLQKKSTSKDVDFLKDYNTIFNNSTNSVIVQSEWNKNGDFFHKLSIYDESYSPIITLGSTTLLKKV